MRKIMIVLGIVASLAVATWVVAPATAEDTEELLDVGDAAPPLAITDWVKGAPVDMSNDEEDRVYLVEFWATWCGPCRASIPHLTELQLEYKDRNVTVIGITMEESDVVKEFVEEAGDTMQYTVAVDGDRATWAAYMDASGARGIPHAFLVDSEGVIVWKGHPRDPNLDSALKELVPEPEEAEA